MTKTHRTLGATLTAIALAGTALAANTATAAADIRTGTYTITETGPITTHGKAHVRGNTLTATYGWERHTWRLTQTPNGAIATNGINRWDLRKAGRGYRGPHTAGGAHIGTVTLTPTRR